MPGYLDKINMMKQTGQLDSTPETVLNGDSTVYEINELSPVVYGDGQDPPENRAPANDPELKRFMDAMASPE